MALKVVDVYIFGRHLKLNCPENTIDALNEAAKELEKRFNEVRDKSQILSSDQIIITAALNIFYELSQEREIVQKLQNAYSERLTNLNDQLESVLNNSKRYTKSKKITN